MKKFKHTNHLISEKNPYLLQHAHNPVQWYPWCSDAFEKARNENKPIFLSIGYSTCHWCHVMAHESFEDPEVANLMNDTFVCIKVDREERPDLDNIYMTICQITTGGGGWPLTIFMTPDKKPFFAATYIPKHNRFGQIGMLDLIPHVRNIWITRRNDLLYSAKKTTASLTQISHYKSGEKLNKDTLKKTYDQLLLSFDRIHGGFGSAPKFPTPQNLLFLLRYWTRTDNKQALEMVEKSLIEMRKSGIYDHVGFGFHRYSTDAKWMVPHFEKMLYDQALLAMVYCDAYQATRYKKYGETAQEIFEYVLRDMVSTEGGFYSAEDADSEGEEGKFYLWKYEEIKKLLTPEETEILVRLFNIKKDGNFTDGATGTKTDMNIFHQTSSIEELVNCLDMSEKDIKNGLKAALNKLFSYRIKRIHPYKDDKILADWNGLMIAAFAKGAQIFDESRYVEAACRSVDFILENMRRSDGGLFHRYRDGQAAVIANVDDYVFLIFGLIELYETTFNTKYLKTALELNGYLLDHFWDDEDGAFYFTSDNDEKLLIRKKEIYDGAIPSGNSVAMLNLLHLGRITANPEFEEKAVMIGSAFSKNIQQSPSAYSQLVMALDFEVGPSYEIVIAGNSQAVETKEMIKAINCLFIPNKVIILRPTEQETPDIVRMAKYTKHQKSLNGKVTVYICRNYTCQSPLTDITKIIEILNQRNTAKIEKNNRNSL